MQPIVFRHDRSKARRLYFSAVPISLVFGLIFLAKIIFRRPDSEIVLWFSYAVVIANGLLAIMVLADIAGLKILEKIYYRGGGSRFRLELDDEGLTYVRGGLRPLRFSWAELSDIGCQGPGFLRKSSVVFRPKVTDFKGWLTLELSIADQRMRLDDIFDAAPEEIAAKLNEYRDRARGRSVSGESRSTSVGPDMP